MPYLKNSILFLLFLLVSCSLYPLKHRRPAGLFSYRPINLVKDGDQLRGTLSSLSSGEKTFDELTEKEQKLLKQYYSSYFDSSFKKRDELVTLFAESTNLNEKLSTMSFMEEVIVKDLKSTITLINDIGPALWHLSNPFNSRTNELIAATTQDVAMIGAGGPAFNTLSAAGKHLAEDFSVLGSVAIRRGARNYMTSFLEDIFNKPGMAIPRDNARLEIFLDFIHTLELYKISSSIDVFADYSDVLFLKLVSEFQLIARQLEGLSKTPGGMFLHLELKSALALFLQELDQPQAFLDDILNHMPADIDKVYRNEIEMSVKSLKNGVELSESMLTNNAQEGLIKKGLRYGFAHIIATGDELSLGFHLFRYYGNDLLTREKDNVALKGARMLLNTTINSAAYSGKGAAFLLERTYGFLGAADPSYTTAVNTIKATASAMLSPVESTRLFLDQCSRSFKNFLKKKP